MDTHMMKERKGIPPNWLRILVFLGGAAVAGVVAGLGDMRLPIVLLIALVIPFVLDLLLRRPEVGLAIMIFFAADVLFVNQAIDLRAFGGGFELRDTFLLLLWVLVLVRSLPTLKVRIIRTPLALPLLIFGVLSLLSGLVAWLFFDVPIFHVMRELLSILSYSVFFLIIAIVRRKEQLYFLLKAALAIALLIAVISIAQYWLGTEFVLTEGRVASTPHETQGLTRVLLPGSFLVNALFVIGLCLMVFSPKHRILLAILTGILGLAVALTWSRNLWLADLLVLSILFLLMTQRQRRRVLLLGLVLAGFVGTGIWGLAKATEGTGQADLVDALGARATEFFRQDDVTRLNTVSGRLVESELALSQIASHPLLGIGLGNVYYEDLYRVWYNRDLEQMLYLPRFIHNGYLWIAMKQGLIAFGTFLWLIVLTLWQAFKSFRCSETPLDRGLSAGLGLSFLGMTFSGAVTPIFMTAPNVVTLATLMGLVAVMGSWADARQAKA